MCSTGHFSIADWKDISIAYVIIIIKSEVSTFPIVIIFFRGCVPEMFVISYSVPCCIYVPGKRSICFHYYCAVYDGVQIVGYRFGSQIVFACLCSTPSHYHHCANLSEDIELIKCLSDVFCRVCEVKHILSVIHYTLCGAVLTHFSCDDWENICIYIYIYMLSYYHHQIGSMNFYPLFRVSSWNNGVRCMPLYILMLLYLAFCNCRALCNCILHYAIVSCTM